VNLTRVISGHIAIPASVRSFSSATAHIRLEDVSYADREAVLIAETIIPNLNHKTSAAGGGDTAIPFTILIPSGTLIIDPRNDYAVRVWVDVDSDGYESPGDLYSDQSYRVLSSRSGGDLSITLAPH